MTYEQAVIKDLIEFIRDARLIRLNLLLLLVRKSFQSFQKFNNNIDRKTVAQHSVTLCI